MMASRIVPIETMEAPRKRRPRVKDASHLDAIRACPCLICQRVLSEAAHLRSASFKYGKLHTGMSEKPSDKWVNPLCSEHHREQHTMSELRFWRQYGIDPFVTAMALYMASGDRPLMHVIVCENGALAAKGRG